MPPAQRPASSSQSGAASTAKLGVLKVRVLLQCPHHDGTASQRELTVFKTRVASARLARRSMSDVIKKHVPALRKYDDLKIAFRPSSAGGPGPTTLTSKESFEAAIAHAIATDTVLSLQVRPGKVTASSSGQRPDCYCDHGQKQAKAASATPATTSASQHSTGDEQAERKDEKKDSVVSKEDLAAALAEINAKYASVCARVDELEQADKSYKDAVSKAGTSHASSSSAASSASQKSLGPRWQSLCADLLTNLNSTLSANFGDEFTSSPGVKAESEPLSHPLRAANHCCVPHVDREPLDAAPVSKSRSSASSLLTGPKQMPASGSLFHCDICKALTHTADRFRCLRCPDWDACHDCALYGLHEHGHSVFAFIPADAKDKLSTKFGQRCERCHVSPSDHVLYQHSVLGQPQQTLCATCFSNSSTSKTLSAFVRLQPAAQDPLLTGPNAKPTSRLPHSRPANGAEVARLKQLQLSYTCDLCSSPIPGKEWRYHCSECKDYDVCSSCWDSCKVDLHHHAGFVEFAPPYPEPIKFGAEFKPSQQMHHATCDLCDAAIVGPRFKCLTCPDFDSCGTCSIFLPSRHPGHRFVQLDRPTQIRKYRGSEQGTIASSGNFFCDGCHSRIQGTRYACLACDDYDLCANCEALPVKTFTGRAATTATALSHRLEHGLHHVFIKIPEAPIEASSDAAGKLSAQIHKEKEQSLRAVVAQARKAVAELASREKDMAKKDDHTKKAEAILKTGKDKSFAPSHGWLANAPRALGVDPYDPRFLVGPNAFARSMQPPSQPSAWDATAHTKASEAKDTSSAGKGSTCVVQHTYLPPKNDRLSFEEKRLLAKRMEEGGEAAMNALLSVLTPEQLAQITPNGDLVLELDDLTERQYYDVMTELEALELSRRDNATSTKDTSTKPTPTTDKTQMSERSASFKTLRQPQPSVESDDEIDEVLVPKKSAEPKLSKQAKVESEAEADAEIEDSDRLELDAEFIKDGNLPDGAVIAAGSRFDKVWVLRNNGTQPWPAMITLQFQGGAGLGLPCAAGAAVPPAYLSATPPLAGLQPGQQTTLRLNSLRAPEFGVGRISSYFRLGAVKEGRMVAASFGNQLWVDVDVRAAGEGSPSTPTPTNTSASTQTATGAAANAVVADKSQDGEPSKSNASSSTGQLGGSSLLSAPHAPESVRSDAGSTAPPSEGGAGKTLRGFRLSDGIDSDDDDEEEQHKQSDGGKAKTGASSSARKPFEDAVLDDSDSEDNDDGDAQAADDDNSDFELIDPTTEESDVE